MTSVFCAGCQTEKGTNDSMETLNIMLIYCHQNSIEVNTEVFGLTLVALNSKKICFHLLEVVCRYRDPQFQVDEKYAFLLIWQIFF